LGTPLRAPLGIHQAKQEEGYWFYAADYLFEEQMAYLMRLKKISEAEMSAFVSGLEMPPEFCATKDCSGNGTAPGERQLPGVSHSRLRERSGGRWRAITGLSARRAPSRAGTESGDNLAVSHRRSPQIQVFGRDAPAK